MEDTSAFLQQHLSSLNAKSQPIHIEFCQQMSLLDDDDIMSLSIIYFCGNQKA